MFEWSSLGSDNTFFLKHGIWFYLSNSKSKNLLLMAVWQFLVVICHQHIYFFFFRGKKSRRINTSIFRVASSQTKGFGYILLYVIASCFWWYDDNFLFFFFCFSIAFSGHQICTLNAIEMRGLVTALVEFDFIGTIFEWFQTLD